MLPISPYSIQAGENTDQENSEYGHFSRSVIDLSSESLFIINAENNEILVKFLRVLKRQWYGIYKLFKINCLILNFKHNTNVSENVK